LIFDKQPDLGERMSLRKSLALTPALLEACRCNACKSRGPRTPLGKANVRMCAWKGPGRSQLFPRFFEASYFTPPGGMTGMARRLLTPDLARHESFRTFAEVAFECAMPAKAQLRLLRCDFGRKSKKKNSSSTNNPGILLKTKGRK
jgi:hypothetical protein